MIWPIQLLPFRPGEQVQRHWRELERAGEGESLAPGGVGLPLRTDPESGTAKAFVTFLPYVQRVLYEAAAGQEIASARAEPSINAFQRDDVARVRVSLAAASTPITLEVGKINLHFFLDADIAIVAFEMHTNDVSIRQARYPRARR